jgi:hypothetical protein
VGNVWADTGLQFQVFAAGTDQRFGITMPEGVVPPEYSSRLILLPFSEQWR